MSRLVEALKWLAGEMSADAAEFRHEFQQGADDLRDGLVAHGFAKHARGRYGVSPAGFRALEVWGG